MDEEKAYLIARRRVWAKMWFLIHLVVYMGVNFFLIYINMETWSGYLWFKWPMLGWGIGLFFHALAVFLFSEWSDLKRQLIEREANKLLEREKQGEQATQA